MNYNFLILEYQVFFYVAFYIFEIVFSVKIFYFNNFFDSFTV